jgi:tRNA(adenine34) deaminase
MYDAEHFMRIALGEARRAFEIGEVPVGAVVALDGEVVSSSHNRTLVDNDPTAHAELLAIREACRLLSSERLRSCELYVTLEPCPMCAGGIVNARIGRLVFGAHDLKAGAAVTLYSITNDSRLNHRCDVVGGILDAESAELLQRFFRDRR